MPEYLAPGVYVEETSFRAKSIEGVGTSTTAFAGPTRKGPVATAELLPEILTSHADFERVYGGFADLSFADGTAQINFLAHGVRAFFNEGGSRLYVARVFQARAADNPGTARTDDLLLPATATSHVRFVARFPGRSGDGMPPTREQPMLAGIQTREIIAPAPQRVRDAAPVGSLARSGVAAPLAYFVKRADGWHAVAANGSDGAAAAPDAAGLAALAAANDDDERAAAQALIDSVSLVTLAVITTDADGGGLAIDDLGYDRAHPRWLGTVMALTPNRRADQIENLYAAEIGSAVPGLVLLQSLFPAAQNADAAAALRGRRGSFMLGQGNDGAEPLEAAYTPAFEALAKIDDIAIVAAPGSSAFAARDAIRNALISHAEGRRMYRIAVLDTRDRASTGEARAARATIDSRHAAMYYPWVVIANPNARPGREDIPREIALPPSGFICGIYARNDIQRGVWKAPANEVVRGALRFEREISFGEQEMLNPLGVNCLRFFPGRGYRVWGARTASSDPEWKYVSVRRFFNYLEASIDRSTQWAVFEPNGERLWANIRETVAAFLYNEWRNGALLGSKPEEAYFVRCDRSTMTQNDLDNGRLVCQIGVAAIKPAEFVIFRIGQKTADTRD